MVDNIQSVKRKAYCALANIGKIRRDLTRPAAETLVNACVSSVMDYANSTSLGVPQVHTNSLQRLQNMTARIICRCGPRDHVTPLRKELHWLPIEARPVFKILYYTYKAIHGNLPDYMCDLVSVYNPKRCGLRSGNSGSLKAKTFYLYLIHKHSHYNMGSHSSLLSRCIKVHVCDEYNTYFFTIMLEVVNLK